MQICSYGSQAFISTNRHNDISPDFHRITVYLGIAALEKPYVSLRKKIMHPLSMEPLITYPLYGPIPTPSPPPPHKQSPSINPRHVWYERILV